MSERATTALLALGALLLFLVLMFGGRSGGGAAGAPSRPTSVESADNGYSLLRRWFEDEGLRVISLRDRFGTLADRAPAGADGASLLVLTLPGAGPIQTRELRPLDRWVRAGNTLLVLAALSDAPDWAHDSAGADTFDLKAVTGLDFESLPQRRARLSFEDDSAGSTWPNDMRRDSRLLAEPQRHESRPVRAAGLLAGVASLVAESDYRRVPWAVRMPYDGLVLELARERASGEGVLWSRSIGRGRIVVSAHGSLLTNRAIGLGDNARLAANLVAASVGPRGVVLFDDGHQGLAPGYDPQQLFGDRRLHATIALLLLLWLLWVLGGTRLRTPQSSLPAPRPADLVRAAGGLFARVLSPAVGARRLCEHFFVRVRVRAGHGSNARSGSGAAAPPWDWLERQPRVAPQDLRQLRDWYAQACEGRRVPLARLHNLILSLDRQMA